jgi:hypothetical protein
MGKPQTLTSAIELADAAYAQYEAVAPTASKLQKTVWLLDARLFIEQAGGNSYTRKTRDVAHRLVLQQIGTFYLSEFAHKLLEPT